MTTGTGNNVALIAALLDSAVTIAKNNQYPSGTGGVNFPSPRMEAITFLHSEYGEGLVLVATGDTMERFLKARGIPPPGEGCMCEICRTNMLPEAIVSNGFTKARQKRFRFALNSRHHVFYRGTHLLSVMPNLDDRSAWLAPDQYIKAMGEINEHPHQ